MQFVAIYSGTNVSDASLVSASHDPALIKAVAEQLLLEIKDTTDPAANAIAEGRRKALKKIAAGATR